MKEKSQRSSLQNENSGDQCDPHNCMEEKEKIIEIDEIDDLCFNDDEIKSLSFEYIKESYSE